MEYEPGSGTEIVLHDGSKMQLTKMEEDLQPDQPHQGNDAAGGGSGEGRGADRTVLCESGPAELYRSAEPGGPAARYAAAGDSSAFEERAGRDHERVPVRSSLHCTRGAERIRAFLL